MKESYEEDLANHFGHPRRAVVGNDLRRSVRQGGKRRPAMELRNQTLSQADPVQFWRRQQRQHRPGEVRASATESKNLSMRGNSKRENRESPAVSESIDAERSANALGGTADMHVAGQSDGSVVPTKPTNNEGAEPSAESAKERDPTQRNTEQDALHRTQSRVLRRSGGLHGVREAATVSRPTQGRSRMR